MLSLCYALFFQASLIKYSLITIQHTIVDHDAKLFEQIIDVGVVFWLTTLWRHNEHVATTLDVQLYCFKLHHKILSEFKLQSIGDTKLMLTHTMPPKNFIKMNNNEENNLPLHL